MSDPGPTWAPAPTLFDVGDESMLEERLDLIGRLLDADELDRLLALRAATSENTPVYLAILGVLDEAKRAYRLQLRTSDIRKRLRDMTTEATRHGLDGDGEGGLRSALDQLRQWGCVEWVQDPAVRVTSIDDGLRRHELWELTAVGDATLRAVVGLLQSAEESGALQRTMFRQIRTALEGLAVAFAADDASGVYLQLQTLDTIISDLASNAREFYATINRVAREERLDDPRLAHLQGPARRLPRELSPRPRASPFDHRGSTHRDR